MKILILDNYDSFTYNLVHQVEQFTIDFDIIRNDRISIDEVDKYDKILLSPGPGLPKEAGMMVDVIKQYSSTKSILGVCLGMQGIVECFGGELYNLKEVMHGIATTINITGNDNLLFKNLPETFEAGRYHSWAVNSKTLPKCFKITAVDEQNTIMAISHYKYDVKGVQFHPESIMTEFGDEIIKNWLAFS